MPVLPADIFTRAALAAPHISLRRLAAAPLRAKWRARGRRMLREWAAAAERTPPAARARGGVLLVGDSHLEFWDRASAALQPHAPVVNFGIAGATVADLAAWADQLVPAWLAPDAIVFWAGGNDLKFTGATAERIVAGCERFAAAAARLAPRAALIFVAAIEPRGAARARARADVRPGARAAVNAALRALCARPARALVDLSDALDDDGTFHADGVHLSERGYARAAAALRAALLSLIHISEPTRPY